VALFGRKLTARQWTEVQERLESLERQMKALTLEWNDAYDRIRHMMGRVAKRSADIARVEEAVVVEHGVAIPGLENPRLAALQQKILSRRERHTRTNGGV
jgi:hypothetical protein